MFFKKKENQQNESQLIIRAERSSVCMGDDCTAPNPADLAYEPDQRLSEFVPVIVKYVPKMKNSWWEVISDGLLVTIYFDGMGHSSYKLNGADIKVADIPEGKIFCRYNY